MLYCRHGIKAVRTLDASGARRPQAGYFTYLTWAIHELPNTRACTLTDISRSKIGFEALRLSVGPR